MSSSYFCSESCSHEKLENTVFENAFIVDKLVNSDLHFQELVSQSKIKQMTSEDICGTNGFTSQVLRLSIVFEKQDTTFDTTENAFTVILKVFSKKRTETLMQTFLGNLMDDTNKKSSINEIMEKMGGLHNTECNFYDMFGYNKDVQAILPLPKIYFTQKIDVATHTSGLIIMEDLSQTAGLISFYEGANVQQALSAVQLHSIGFSQRDSSPITMQLDCLD